MQENFTLRFDLDLWNETIREQESILDRVTRAGSGGLAGVERPWPSAEP